MWIVIEGPDKCGKSTLIEHLKHALRDRTDVLFTREPGSYSDPICIKLRDHILDPRTRPLTSALLFLADRAQHEEAVVRPALRRGVHVVQDRGAMSTFVYQVICDPEHGAAVNRLIHALYRDFVPDVTILLKPSKDALNARKGEPDDKYELDSEKYDRAYAAISCLDSASWLRLVTKELVILPHDTVQHTKDAVATILQHL